MSFSRKLRLKVLWRAQYRCCVCQKVSLSLEVHHVIPVASGGDDTEENAAPLCPVCHSDFGDNPAKRKAIKDRRDYWYEYCDRRTEPGNVRQLAEMVEGLEKTITAAVGTINSGRIEPGNVRQLAEMVERLEKTITAAVGTINIVELIEKDKKEGRAVALKMHKQNLAFLRRLQQTDALRKAQESWVIDHEARIAKLEVKGENAEEQT